MTGPGIVAEKRSVCRTAGGAGDQRFDVGQEAEVQHFIGFVKDDHLDVLEAEVLLLVEIDQPAGRAHYDFDALLQGINLRLVRTAP